MTSKTTIIFAAVMAVFAVSVAGASSSFAVSDPTDYYDEYYEIQHYQWVTQNYKDVAGEVMLVENAWKVGILDDADYFWSLMNLYYTERSIIQEFGDYDWKVDNESAEYIQSVVDNPTAEKKIEALIASK